MSDGGCWANGCFICSSACLFYRIHIRATTHGAAEVFDCSWDYRVRIDATVHVGNVTKRTSLTLIPGVLAKSNEFSATWIGSTIPPLPELGTRFVRDYGKIAQIPREHTYQPTVECKTEREARQAHMENCSLPPVTCSCENADSTVVCDCPRNGISPTEFLYENPKNTTLLPKYDGPTWLKYENREVTAEPSVGSTELQIEVQGLTLQTKVERNKCTVTSAELMGCRSCANGATLRYKCTTDFGTASAHVHCETMSFSLQCYKNQTQTTLRLFTEKQYVDEVCEVCCPGGKTTFRLHGVLHYSHKEGEVELYRQSKDIPQGFTLSDLGGFLWSAVIVPDLKMWLWTASAAVVVTVITGVIFFVVEIKGSKVPLQTLLRTVAVLAILNGHADGSIREAKEAKLWTKTVNPQTYDPGNSSRSNETHAFLSRMTTESNARPIITAPSAFLEITDNSKYGWEPNCACSTKTPGHEECTPMSLAHLEPAYKGKEIGRLRVYSFLQIAMCLYALRDGFGAFTESFMRELLEELEGVEECVTTSAIHVFTEFCKHRSFQTMPTSEDIFRAIEKRTRFCKKARETLVGKMMSEVYEDDDETKYRPIKYDVNVHEFAAEFKHEWLRLMQCVPAQLERFKIAVSFSGKQRVVNPTVLIGDSVMREFRRVIKPNYFAVDGKMTADLTKHFEDAVFVSGEVKKIVIMTGRDDILKKLPTEVVHNSLGQLIRCAKKYPHVDVLVTPPPYIHSQAYRERWQSFMEGFEKMVQDLGATAVTMIGGRCFTEIFRDGASNDSLAVDVDGKPTMLGARKMANFLKEVLEVPLHRNDNERRIFPREEKKDAPDDDVLIVHVDRSNDSSNKPSTSRRPVEPPKGRDGQANNRQRQQTHRGSQKSRKRQYDDKSDGRVHQYGKKPRK